MSESSEDKTKRKHLEWLDEYEWVHQYSIFYDDPAKSVNLLTDRVGFHQALTRAYPKAGFLSRIQSLKSAIKGQPPQAYLMILASKKVSGMDAMIHRWFSSKVNLMSQPQNTVQLRKMYQTIKAQTPHDLRKVFKDHKGPIKRYSPLNKKQMVKRAVNLMETEE